MEPIDRLSERAEARSVAPTDIDQINALSERPETRSAEFKDMEVSRDGWSFEGLLSVYDDTADLGSFTESFARGAYRKVLANGDNVPMLYHHNDALPVLATTRGGTLSLKDDAKGVRVKANLAQHYVGEAVRELVKRGDIKGMSPGFLAGAGNSRLEKRNGKLHRTIVGLKKLLDVSTTWLPAYEGTTAELRSLRTAEHTAALAAFKDVVGDDEKAEALMNALASLFVVDLGAHTTLETSQSSEGGAHQQPDGEATQDPEADAGNGNEETPAGVIPDVGEQRSGVPHEREGAARRRRLQMLALTLPDDDRSWLARPQADEPQEQRTRPIQKVLQYPRETWSPEEQSIVLGRLKQVQAEMVTLMDVELRTGRLSPEDTTRVKALEDEFARLRR
jgi:HK97 family phage prohead protease